MAIFYLQADVAQLLAQRAQRCVQAAQVAFYRVAAGDECRRAKLVVARFDPQGAGSAPVEAVSLGRNPTACGFAARGGAVHTAQVLQLLEQPAGHFGVEANVGQQRVCLGLWGRVARRGDVVAVAVGAGDGFGPRHVVGVLQQHHPARGAQHAFDGGAPVLVAHFHHLGQKAVADFLGLQALAQAPGIVGERRGVLAL